VVKNNPAVEAPGFAVGRAAQLISPPVTTSDALQLARQLQASGRFPEAEAAYRHILASDPNDAGALQGLGGLAHRAGHHQIALQLLDRALQVRPTDYMLHWQRAIVSEQTGQIEKADAAYTRACELNPKDRDLMNNWGMFLARHEQRERALKVFKRVCKFHPDFAQAPYHAGMILDELEQYARAEAAFRESLRLAPHSADTLQRLGLVIGKSGRAEESLEYFHRALEIDPAHFDANFNLAVACRLLLRYEEATAPLERGMASRPTSQAALKMAAQNFASLGRHQEALRLVEKGLAMHPDDSNLHGQRAMSLLALGNLAEGFKEYEWRWRADSFPQNRRFSHAPQWTGFDITDKTILLHAEQGYGDALQFIRYAPLIAQRGARVLLYAQEDVLPLLKTVGGIAEVIEPGQLPPKFDVQCPLLSLPYAFGTTLETIPANVPYLHADETKIEQWKPRLQTTPDTRKIGLVWAGRPTHPRDAERSIPLTMLQPLSSVADAKFFSLQKGKAAAEQIEGFNLVPLGADLKDFADTAAVIAQLDLLICVDTAVAHLAGAMGKPVWTLIGSFTDFRWMLDREDSPWYPTMRLFRQTPRGDWSGLIQRVVTELGRKQ
jgi:tetratricopeptide (TPR) repeat protein